MKKYRTMKLLISGAIMCASFCVTLSCTPKPQNEDSSTQARSSLGKAQVEAEMETEFWKIIEDPEGKGIELWQEKARVMNLKHGATNLPRLNILQSFACMRSVIGFNIMRIPDCLFQSTQAVELNPHNENSRVAMLFQQAVKEMLASNAKAALAHVATLETLGTEGLVSAAIAYSYWKKGAYLDRALTILGDCRNENCRKHGPLTPSKEHGMLLTLAEIQGRAGKKKEMEETLSRFETLARQSNYPYIDEADKLRRDLPEKKKLWDAGLLNVGLLAMPLPNSANANGCSLCHYGVSAELKKKKR